MRKRVCLKCGKRAELQGQVEGIRMGLCCRDCCLKFIVPYEKFYVGSHRFPERLARKIYGCSKKDLSALDYCEVSYLGRERPVRLYLGAEVECIGAMRNSTKWREQSKRKKIDLQAVLGIKWKRASALLRFFILGDYLRCPGTPRTTVEDIRQRINVLDRVQRIKNVCKHAHPSAIFDFCIANPTAGPEEFEAFKEKVQMVFRLEGTRIMRNLTKMEREALLDSPLKDCVGDFNKRDKRDIIRSYLQQSVPADVANKIMRHPACQLRIDREDDEEKTAKKLLKFWRERQDPEVRRNQLSLAFRRKNVCWHGSSLPQKQYIFGLIDCEAEEIVGLEEIATRGPFSLLSKHRFEKVSIAVAKFEECFISRRMTYETSIKEAIVYAQKVPLPLVRDVHNCWDFKQMTTGFWSERWYLL